jgi:hypothetical protein
VRLDQAAEDLLRRLVVEVHHLWSQFVHMYVVLDDIYIGTYICSKKMQTSIHKFKLSV